MSEPILDVRPIRCRVCGETKLPEEFYLHTTNGKPRKTCKVCDRARQRVYNQSKYMARRGWAVLGTPTVDGPYLVWVYLGQGRQRYDIGYWKGGESPVDTNVWFYDEGGTEVMRCVRGWRKLPPLPEVEE